ncbi:kinesin motor domain protein [Ichthyophthirius multifiliis]|uniref:Kinesin motor domain protein n=1 Tax=Ichthyophthirius multifiliis TaxID=5932 RepID=G0QZ81_ICHMU|nr:kinesin motor domain protein [Ichthyophthirius multifiliis]EGR29464.1 kinesin motor domain protein [Ichthyophthirius multifiliis]|eukprot:XP_004030700.1 kinesin motor domain protein [Ichthyophthirius multifiliis]
MMIKLILKLKKIHKKEYMFKQIRATKLNEYSSRSHTIFMFQINQKLANGSEKNGKLNLVDLAGCENISKSGAFGENLEEAIKINLSITSLGKVIFALNNEQDFIPYRNSKLTRILQESLGGNYQVVYFCLFIYFLLQKDFFNCELFNAFEIY